MGPEVSNQRADVLRSTVRRRASLLQLLNTGRRFSVLQLAMELEWSNKTIDRDLSHFKDLGLVFDINHQGHKLESKVRLCPACGSPKVEP